MVANKKQPIFTKEQLALSAVLSIFLGVIFTGLFVGEGILLKKDTASRATALIALATSFMLFLGLCGTVFWLISIANKENKLLFFLAITASFVLALRFFTLTITLWRKLN